ncbi:MAG: 8-amino-7-oxononanoate synthase [Candidatus Omnitrophota bacterium]
MTFPFIEETLQTLKAAGLRRHLRTLESSPDPHAVLDGKKVLLFSSNNYLGLSRHPKVIEAAVQATREFGTGGTASRLVSGNSKLYAVLEEKIAHLKKTEGSVVFASGYAANLGAIQALVGPGDLVVIDKLNHASIIDGCRLSGAHLKTYRHKQLELLKARLQTSDPKRRTLIITDGIFSMDGDVAPLSEIAALAEAYGAMVMVDDAHATGLWGERGAGTVHAFGLEGADMIQMGTLSKAVGSLGGFVAGTKSLVDFLINEARSLVYSTALPPSVLAASIAAFTVLEERPELIENFWKKIRFFKNELLAMGYDLMGSETHILPLRIGGNEEALALAKALFDEGLYAPAIRPPTVPKGTSRIRLTPMATHTQEDLEQALDILRRVGRKFGMIH